MSLAAVQARAYAKLGAADPRQRNHRYAESEKARRIAALKAEGFVIPLSEWIGHNNGPEWFDDFALFREWCWERAHRKAWAPPSQEIGTRRARKAAALGLTYKQYALEIMERGRFPDEDLAASLRGAANAKAGTC